MGGHDFAHWAEIIGQVGFPVVALLFCGYFIFYIWKWVTKTIDPALDELGGSLGRLKKDVTALDNDLIRLQQKVNTVVEYRKQQELKKEGKQDENISTSRKSTRKYCICRPISS